MKLPENIKVYGDTDYRGACPAENAEQVTFFNRIRKRYPETYGALALHPRNEGRRTLLQAAHQKAEGMTTGATDIVIPAAPPFVCELKRRDHTKSEIRPEQAKFMEAAQQMGAFCCIALGVDAAWRAFEEYVAARETT